MNRHELEKELKEREESSPSSQLGFKLRIKIKMREPRNLISNLARKRAKSNCSKPNCSADGIATERLIKV